MALIVRLRQQGKNRRHSFRLVVADRSSPRDGKYIELLGFYDPFTKDNFFSVDKERVEYWFEKGALFSERAKLLLKKAAPEIVAKMNQRKEKKPAKKGNKKA